MGILKGLGVTFKHFVDTFVDDVKYAGKKYFNQDVFEERQGLAAAGAYTVQYPEEKIAVPERFRFVPFLVVNDYDAPQDPGRDWCTSCGICAKVCPPQCIWIVRGEDPETGRPVPEPEAFYIDIDICMNCGFCAEFCPFDAIKMDHDYELASYDRTGEHVYDKEKLSKEYSYWHSIAPTRAVEEAKRATAGSTRTSSRRRRSGPQGRPGLRARLLRVSGRSSPRDRRCSIGSVGRCRRAGVRRAGGRHRRRRPPRAHPGTASRGATASPRARKLAPAQDRQRPNRGDGAF